MTGGVGEGIVAVLPSSDWVPVLALSATVLVLWRSGFFGRLLRIVEETISGNWQLAVLGAAAIALSLASGYTTFDGLRNFTFAPLLSALVAFGVQGVMLIVAWLIGESFATGMGQATAGASAHRRSMTARETALGLALGAVLIGLAFWWALDRYGAIGLASAAGGSAHLRADWQRVADVGLPFLMGLAILGLIVLAVRRGGDIARSYVQTVRLIAKNAMLWAMLLACMSATVFFSMDSHFNAIFPADQRKRAAEIRTLSQIGAIVADIGERIRKVQAAEAAHLIASDGWKAYDAELGALALAARGAQAEIDAALVAKLEERQQGIGEQQERIASAERSRSALLRRRDDLEAELQRLEGSIGALEAELARAQAAYDAARQAIATKQIEAAAEDGGVEGSLKRGKGPAWRQRMAEVEELQRKLKLADEPRLKEAQSRRDAASGRIVGLKREIASIVAEAAKYKGAISAAEQRIKTAQAGDGGAGRIGAAGRLEALERARAAFRQRPEAEALAALQAQCRSLVAALSAAASASERAGRIDCDAKTAGEAAARLFALNAGLATFEAGCAGGSRLPQKAGTDELLAFGRKCLQDSGLASRDTADLGARFQAIDMNRDDRAHRFVVTWNAMLDGNRLAYLSLALATGIDALVFMAGLFGAAAVRSPLSDVPSPRARSADRLEGIVRNALGADRLETAELVLAALRPAPGDGDRRSEVDLAECEAETADRIRKVLVAGRSIGAVERAPAPAGARSDRERYLVRPELVEFLAAVASTARNGLRPRASRARLVGLVGAALAPDRPGNAAIVLRHAEPVEAQGGFVARVKPGAVAREKERRVVQGVLSAGMSAGAAVRSGRPGGVWRRLMRRSAPAEAAYLIDAELFETLLHYRASAPAAPAVYPVHRAARPVPLTATDAPAEDASYEDLPAPLAAGRLIADGRAGEEWAHDGDEDELRRHLRHALLQELASAAAAAAGVGERPGRDAGAALERLAREATRALQRAARALARGHGGNPRIPALVEEICRDLAGSLPRLLPGLLDDAIGEAERAGDDDLGRRLRQLRDAMAAQE